MNRTLRAPVPTDDSLLDNLAAQVRANPPLPGPEVAALLASARRSSGGDEAIATLARHHLGEALDAAIAQYTKGDDVAELYQEGALAVVAAVKLYVAGSGAAEGLRDHVRSSVMAHVGDVQSIERLRREEQEAFVRDSKTLDLVEVALRQKLGRVPTTPELVEILGWEPERVDLVVGMLDEARRTHDESLIPFLEDDAT